MWSIKFMKKVQKPVKLTKKQKKEIEAAESISDFAGAVVSAEMYKRNRGRH